MAIKITYSDKPATAFVGASSRYAASQVITLGERNVPTFELYKGKTIPSMSRDVQWTEITHNVEYRPDLVSYELYGTPDFWWKIMEINNMKDIMEFRAGRAIMIPTTILA